MSTRALTRLTLALCLSVSLVAGGAAANEPILGFDVAGRPVGRLDLAELSTRLHTRAVELFDPHYMKRKRFRAFALADVMGAGFGESWRHAPHTEVVFTARDGYRAVSAREKVAEAGGYLAFADLDAEGGWEPLPGNRTDPGPFYVVWLGDGQGTAQGYPWPWQLAQISMVRVEDAFPAVFPNGAPEDSSVLRGYGLFKDRCLRCHAMNEQGGKVGPDLNAPMSVVEYRSPMMIRAFIRHPSRYRHTHMPDHEDLSDRDLDDLLDYFRHQARPVPATPTPDPGTGVIDPGGR